MLPFKKMTTKPRRHIGEIIRRLRRERGRTQAELGRRVQLPHPLRAWTISKIERGVTAPTVTTLAAIAGALARSPIATREGRAGSRTASVVPLTPRREQAFMTIWLNPPDWEIVRVTFAPGQDPPAPAELLLGRPPEDFWATGATGLGHRPDRRTRTLYYKVTGIGGGGIARARAAARAHRVSADEAEHASAISCRPDRPDADAVLQGGAGYRDPLAAVALHARGRRRVRTDIYEVSADEAEHASAIELLI